MSLSHNAVTDRIREILKQDASVQTRFARVVSLAMSHLSFEECAALCELPVDAYMELVSGRTAGMPKSAPTSERVSVIARAYHDEYHKRFPDSVIPMTYQQAVAFIRPLVASKKQSNLEQQVRDFVSRATNQKKAGLTHFKPRTLT